MISIFHLPGIFCLESYTAADGNMLLYILYSLGSLAKAVVLPCVTRGRRKKATGLKAADSFLKGPKMNRHHHLEKWGAIK